MTFWSIVGQAIPHTAGRSGPSTMDRSNREGFRLGVSSAGTGSSGAVAGEVPDAGAVAAGTEVSSASSDGRGSVMGGAFTGFGFRGNVEDSTPGPRCHGLPSAAGMRPDTGRGRSHPSAPRTARVPTKAWNLAGSRSGGPCPKQTSSGSSRASRRADSRAAAVSATRNA